MVDVRGALAAGANNTLRVVLRPAFPYAQEADARYPYEIPSNVAPRALPHYNFIRKPASVGVVWLWRRHFYA